MKETIEIGGKSYPIAFTMNALAHYSRYKGLALQDLNKILQDIDLLDAFHLVFYGLKDGHRLSKSKKDFALTVEDIGDYITKDEGILVKAIDIYSSQLSSKSDSEKKNKATRART